MMRICKWYIPIHEIYTYISYIIYRYEYVRCSQMLRHASLNYRHIFQLNTDANASVICVSCFMASQPAPP